MREESIPEAYADSTVYLRAVQGRAVKPMSYLELINMPEEFVSGLMDIMELQEGLRKLRS